jgi:hypothetical protein
MKTYKIVLVSYMKNVINMASVIIMASRGNSFQYVSAEMS